MAVFQGIMAATQNPLEKCYNIERRKWGLTAPRFSAVSTESRWRGKIERHKVTLVEARTPDIQRVRLALYAVHRCPALAPPGEQPTELQEHLRGRPHTPTQSIHASYHPTLPHQKPVHPPPPTRKPHSPLQNSLSNPMKHRVRHSQSRAMLSE